MTKPRVLVTGASSGIGRALAREFAARGYDLIISARREALLRELADELPCDVLPIPADLTLARGARTLYDHVSDTGVPVDVLVNNAGFLAQDRFDRVSRKDVLDMVNLNVRALTELSHLYLNDMVSRGCGRVLNVASVAGFSATPGLSIYGATKSFVLSLSEALAEEMRGTGVTVTALCPGITKTDMVEHMNAPVPAFMLSDAERVAREGVDACLRGEVIRVPGVFNQALVGWLDAQPRWCRRLVSGFAGRATQSSDRDVPA